MSGTNEQFKGGCLCGAVRFVATGQPKAIYWCHCDSCRSHTGAPVSVFVLFDCANYTVIKGEITKFDSTPGATKPGFAAKQSFYTGGVFPYSVKAADVNDDGKPDLIVGNEASDTVAVLLNDTAPGAATPSFTAQQTFATGSSPYSVKAVDVNGDGKPDLIVANEASNTVSVLLNTTLPGATTSSFTTQQTFATGSSPYSVVAVDANGDGLPSVGCTQRVGMSPQHVIRVNLAVH